MGEITVCLYPDSNDSVKRQLVMMQEEEAWLEFCAGAGQSRGIALRGVGSSFSVTD